MTLEHNKLPISLKSDNPSWHEVLNRLRTIGINPYTGRVYMEVYNFVDWKFNPYDGSVNPAPVRLYYGPRRHLAKIDPKPIMVREKRLWIPDDSAIWTSYTFKAAFNLAKNTLGFYPGSVI